MNVIRQYNRVKFDNTLLHPRSMSWDAVSYTHLCLTLAENFDDNRTETIQVLKQDSIKIEFKNVSFRYPETEKLVLKNISFTINPNSSLSIVGINGCLLYTSRCV